MKFPKPFLGRAIIEAIEESSAEYLRTQYKAKMEAKGIDITKSSLVLDDPEIYTREIKKEMTGTARRNPITGEIEYDTVAVLGKNKADNKVPLYRGKILEMAPDFCGERFLANNPDVGDVPGIGDIVWFIPNETMAMDSAKKYHLINDCDIVAFEKGEIA